ncbi:guanylate cyclase soluble subunit beta-2-like isoform X2 [Lytechinus variegatus]|uniref:guanylate cyclase soluble subunit beta-2-like isoform X2 n=1 Tax=Lytechinus variegatus TaxID=7654 RepID=UPI001BB1B937|nr:guanylate cyclase soluble subunit beta-2-like isoform X2 [Lytechinus variegatus]XP_041482707.1 guanylate cyclase soluble subunit beta-2-like isoform X2 [Lytechinus variegatus]
MYGFINICVKALVTEKFGEEAWIKIKTLAGVDDSFISHTTYTDGITLKLVKAASDVAGQPIPVILELFGEFFFTFCQRSGYDEMLRVLGSNLKSFLENLDALHSYLSFSYKKMEAPSFRCERRQSDGALILHYYSHRKGLHPIVVGIVRAVAREFFQSEVRMDVLDETHEEERNGKKEHVTFAIFQKKLRIKDPTSPKSVSDKTQQSESEHNKEDEDHNVRQRQDLKPNNERPATLNVQSLVSLANDYGSFSPSYPEKLWLDQRMFCEYFPYHLVFDSNLRLLQSGVHIQRALPKLRTMEDTTVDILFNMLHPQIDWSVPSIRKFINMQFVLETKREMIIPGWGEEQPMLQLRGQMIWMDSLDAMLFACSPRVASLKELEERNLHLSDIPLHDITRDLILFNHQRLAEIELGKQLEQKKEELRSALGELEAEKKKTDMLLHSMLPRQVADQLRDGKKVEAGEFELVTILFSDIVSFTNICSKCRPIDIVNMLNALYTRFDKLTSVHDVYKVETIGDAYMVVGGLPIPVASHAARIANQALGMMVICKEVMSPVTREPIGIRVGIHSGPVVAGVVGEKMPRYCLFGDTVNTASRMESHGLPSKIHLSDNTYRCLEGHSFRFSERGEIMVKGKGMMKTYFLEENGGASLDQIMGKGSSKASTPEKTDRCKSPPETPTNNMANGVSSFHHNSTVVVPMWYPDNDMNGGSTIHVAPSIFPNASTNDTESSKEAANMANAACAATSRPGADGQDARTNDDDNVSSRSKYLGQGSAKTRPLRSGRPPDIRGSKTCVLL